MGIVVKVLGRVDGIDPKYGIDPLLLTSEERASPHFVAHSAAGRNVRVSLPRGTEIQDGDVLVFDGDWAVVARAAEEDLLMIRPGADPVAWWAACYQLGNLHRPARFLPDAILTPADAMAYQNMKDLGISVERVRRPFLGRRFAAAQGLGGHHHHDHHHEHDHHHDGGDHDHHHDASDGHAHHPPHHDGGKLS